jgi:hypothetical protein
MKVSFARLPETSSCNPEQAVLHLKRWLFLIINGRSGAADCLLTIFPLFTMMAFSPLLCYYAVQGIRNSPRGLVIDGRRNERSDNDTITELGNS